MTDVGADLAFVADERARQKTLWRQDRRTEPLSQAPRGTLSVLPSAPSAEIATVPVPAVPGPTGAGTGVRIGLATVVALVLLLVWIRQRRKGLE